MANRSEDSENLNKAANIFNNYPDTMTSRSKSTKPQSLFMMSPTCNWALLPSQPHSTMINQREPKPKTNGNGYQMNKILNSNSDQYLERTPNFNQMKSSKPTRPNYSKKKNRTKSNTPPTSS